MRAYPVGAGLVAADLAVEVAMTTELVATDPAVPCIFWHDPGIRPRDP